MHGDRSKYPIELVRAGVFDFVVVWWVVETSIQNIIDADCEMLFSAISPFGAMSMF
jgi:hypothetical protein